MKQEKMGHIFEHFSAIDRREFSIQVSSIDCAKVPARKGMWR